MPFPSNCIKLLEGPNERMPPVAPEELLMLVEKSVAQSPDDPLTILLPNPEDPEGFQPLLLSDRPLTCNQRDNFYLPSSLFC